MTMLKAGVIGFGGLGHVHATAYAKRTDVQLVAVADIDPERLTGKSVEINLGEGQSFDTRSVRTYRSGDMMLAHEALDLVSICLPTDLHAKFAIRALRKGLHVLTEKPMSRTLRQADAELAAQEQSGRLLMVAQCLRFWPCYERLLEAHQSGEFGNLLMLSMRRVSAPPGWGGPHSWFMDGRRSGGCLLDLHVHDTDFVNHLLGVPEAVVATGKSHISGAIDNSFTQYVYPQGPLVMAEANWSYGGGFSMGFAAFFEQATLEVGYRDGKLRLLRPGREPEEMNLPATNAYEAEIGYFINCIQSGKSPERCLPASTRETMRIALCEERSALAGGRRIRL